MTLSGNWNYPTSVRFGAGKITELADACRTLGMSKPLLVTDPGLAALPMIAQAVSANEAAGLPTGLFSDIKANPVGANVEAGVEVYRSGGHDGVIAFGGGSGLDAAKAVALMSGQSRGLWDFEDAGDNWAQADPDGIAPIVAVPTTSGTGSETGRAALVINEKTETKKIIFHPKMLPGLVIADPALTVSLPPHLTATTGMDAFAHSLEAYSAPGYHPMADGVAIEAIRLIRENLTVAVRDGGNMEARSNMMAASIMGSTAFQKGLGAIHSLSHPVGAVYDAHHGLCNAVFMPYVLAFNRPAIEDRLARLARYLGLEEPSFDGFLDWVLELREELNIPHTAESLGIEQQRLDDLAQMAYDDPATSANPVPAGVPEMRALFMASLEGQLNR